MTIEIVIFLSLLTCALLLFTRQIFPLEISALLIMIALVLTGILPAQDAFSSFGNPAIILIGSLFVLTGGLRKTGIIDQAEALLLRVGRNNRRLSFLLTIVAVALISTFLSNTATLVVALPIVVSVANSFNESAKRWLLPIAYASILGGSTTLIGTSTNIIASNLLPQYGIERLSLFTPAWAAVPVLVVGLIFLLTCSSTLIREDDLDREQDVEIKYDLRAYTAEVSVLQDSPLRGKTISESKLFNEFDILVLRVARSGSQTTVPRGNFILQAGDRLLVEGDIQRLTAITGKYGLKFSEELKNRAIQNEADKGSIEFCEVLVTARSPLRNRTVANFHLRHRYPLSLIAIHRQGTTLHEKLSDVRIAAGDILIMQLIGQVDNSLLDFLGLVPLKKIISQRYNISTAALASLIFIASILVGSFTSIPLALSSLTGAVLMVILGILTAQDIYDQIEWRVLIFIAAVLCIGKGMELSGTAAYASQLFGSGLKDVSPSYALGFFFGLTVIVTNLMSNQATVAVMIPLALETSTVLGLNSMPFVIAVTLASSCCFITPFEPVLMLVFGPGRYSMKDFVKVGLPLALIASVIATLIIPIVWPLVP